MYERIGVRFETFAAVERFLARAAKFASAVQPTVLRALEPDVTCFVGEPSRNRMWAIRALSAI